MKCRFSKTKTINIISLSLLALAVSSCSGSYIKNKEVARIPEGKYERIIKLYNPQKNILSTGLVGIVFIAENAGVCTDFPYEETIKSIDELDQFERKEYDSHFTSYAIKEKSGGAILGYVAIRVPDYKINIWENKKDPNCKYKVNVICDLDNKPGICSGNNFGDDLGINGGLK